jgi:hypothetical protein
MKLHRVKDPTFFLDGLASPAAIAICFHPACMQGVKDGQPATGSTPQDSA